MRAVLGIDAAWTLTQPSGVALAAEVSSGWRVIASASSYQRFLALANHLPEEGRPSGSLPDAPALLASASILCGHPIDLVAVDMPLARTPIVGRRISDDAVSRAYGGRKCGTHTPSILRPGRMSDHIRDSFDLAGYPLVTNIMAPIGLIEAILIRRWWNLRAPQFGCRTKRRRFALIGHPPPRQIGVSDCFDNGVRS